MARIRKHRKKWQVLYRDPKTNKERSAGVFTRKVDARRVAGGIEDDIETGQYIDPERSRTTYQDWVDPWMAARTDLKPKTIAGYESLLHSRILPTFAEFRIGRIEATDIENWIAGMHREGLSASRICQSYHLLSSSLEAAARSRYIRHNPAVGIRLPRIEQREMEFLESFEVISLAAETGDQFKALVYVLGFCGLRVGEALALRRSSVNLMRSELRIVESLADVNGHLIFGPTKTWQARTVVMPGVVQDELEHHLDSFTAPAPDALVFTSSGGHPIRLQNFRRRVWKPAVRRAGLPDGVQIHDMRHTAASLLANAGVPMKSIQEHLGHSSITVTMDRYAHLNDRTRKKVATVLDELISNASETQFQSETDQMRTKQA